MPGQDELPWDSSWRGVCCSWSHIVRRSTRLPPFASSKSARSAEAVAVEQPRPLSSESVGSAEALESSLPQLGHVGWCRCSCIGTCGAVGCGGVPHHTAPHRTAPHCTTLHPTAWYCTALHGTAPHRMVLHSTAPHRTAPHRTPPHRTPPHVRCSAVPCRPAMLRAHASVLMYSSVTDLPSKLTAYKLTTYKVVAHRCIYGLCSYGSRTRRSVNQSGGRLGLFVRLPDHLPA